MRRPFWPPFLARRVQHPRLFLPPFRRAAVRAAFRWELSASKCGGPAAVRRCPLKLFPSSRPGSHLLWDPAHLSSRVTEKGEVTAILVPAAGSLVALDPHKAGAHAEWQLPAVPSVLVLVLGPQGLSISKVKSMVSRDQDLLTQLADYAEQTSEVEALIQQLADSEDSGVSADAALKGFSARYGVAVPKLDTSASSGQQASVLLHAVLPSANTYDPLAPTSTQMQQSVGLAAAVAGMFFGNGFGLAAGGTALIGNLKTALFPNTELRTAFAQAAGTDTLALCTKNVTPKSRTRIAYLWAYRIPNLKPPVVAVAGAAHLPLGTKSAVKLQTAEGASVKELDRARDWRLVPAAGGPPVPITATVQGAGLEVDLSKAKLAPGDYRLTASWDWDAVSLGTLHLHPYGDFSQVRIAPESREKLVEGSGTVPVKLTGTDFEFIDKATIRKAASKTAATAALDFELPKGKCAGEQKSIDVEIDTAAHGAYRLLLAQSDGKTHEVPLTILPPNPKLSNLPLRINAGETVEPIRLEGSNLEQIESVGSGVGAITGAAQRQAWLGEIAVKKGLRTGQRFALVLKLKGLDTPMTVADAIEVVGPRPRILAVRRSMVANSGVDLHENELPAGTIVGMVLEVKGLHDGARPRLDLSCKTGDSRRALALSPDEPTTGANLTFAGPGELYLSLDPGVVGYTGCGLTAAIFMQPEGLSDAVALGRVVRVPRLEQFSLTAEQIGPSTYVGVLKGWDLDLVEKTGWDTKNGLPVEAIPTPVPGEPGMQTLRVSLPWPSPAPHAPLYVWLRGEPEGRRTPISY